MAYKIKDSDGNELIINRGKLGYKITVLTNGHDQADFHISNESWRLINLMGVPKIKGD